MNLFDRDKIDEFTIALLYLNLHQPSHNRAVLQKSEEGDKERSFTVLLLCLDGHSEEFCDECRLTQTISFAHSLHLPLPDHVH